MAESIIQPDINPTQVSDATTTEHSVEQAPQAAPATPIPTPAIIWTPSFIVIFALVLVLGLSTEGVLTQGSVSRFYPRNWVLLAHVIVVLGCWIVIVVRTRSWWIRAGGLFACIWALFAGFDFILDPRSIDPSSPIVAHLHAARSIALLGSYICLSLDRTPFHRWDAWFFRLAPIVGSCAVARAYFLTPPDNRSLSTLESAIALTALFICVFVWWIRPSCWKAQPGPTFLFGTAPVILLFLAIPNVTDVATHLFLSQVVFLCTILGAIRILRCEMSKPERADQGK